MYAEPIKERLFLNDLKHICRIWNMSATLEWITMKFCPDIYGTQKMDPEDYGDHLSIPLASPTG